MNRRYSAWARPAFLLSAVLAFLPLSASGQTSPASRKAAWTPPKTAWGEPELQGTYSNKTITPFERPAQFGERAELTDEEIADLESRAASRTPRIVLDGSSHDAASEKK